MVKESRNNGRKSFAFGPVQKAQVSQSSDKHSAGRVLSILQLSAPHRTNSRNTGKMVHFGIPQPFGTKNLRPPGRRVRQVLDNSHRRGTSDSRQCEEERIAGQRLSQQLDSHPVPPESVQEVERGPTRLLEQIRPRLTPGCGWFRKSI